MWQATNTLFCPNRCLVCGPALEVLTLSVTSFQRHSPKKRARAEAGPKLWERVDRKGLMTRADLTGAASNSSSLPRREYI